LPGIKHNQGTEPIPGLGHVDQAVALLGQGGVVAFPTETWYGLAVDPLNEQALARLFAVKKRPADKPVLVLISKRDELFRLIRAIPPQYHGLMERFWPGPLTLVFPARDGLPDQLTAGSGTIAVRYSPHPLARALIERFGAPLTATSANLSGRPACATAAAVRDEFGSGIDMVLDGGATPGGKGSTIVCCRQGKLICLRDGQIDCASVLTGTEETRSRTGLAADKEQGK